MKFPPSNDTSATNEADGPINVPQLALSADITPLDLLAKLSGFVARSLHASPQIGLKVQQIAANPIDETAILSLWGQREPSASLATQLRRWRNTLMIAFAQRSLNGQADLNEVIGGVSVVAKIAVQTALNHAANQMQTDFGIPCDSQERPQDLMVMGMGKLGGQELNVSSDIDLVLLYREQGQSTGTDALGSKIAASEYFARLVKIAVPLIEEVTQDGFVFRVDLRLRPHGDSGPIAVSLGYLEDYLVSEGRAWERFAWLKSDLIATTLFCSTQQRQSDSAQLKSIVDPFVFRRYLDFSAIASLRELHSLIQNEQVSKHRRRNASQGVDVKLGRGGIREVEFCVQLLQIIRAGRDASLRERSTLAAIEKLRSIGIIAPAEALDLHKSYCLLRQIEHAIQWREDQQTHWLDFENTEQVAQVAQFLRLSPEALLEQLALAMTRVGAVFEQFVFDQSTTGQSGNALASNNDNNAPLSSNVASEDSSDYERSFFEGSKFSRTQDTVRHQVRDLIDRCKASLRNQSVATRELTLRRLLDLIERLLGRSGYIALLSQFPMALDRLIKLIAYSQWAAQFITRYPIVIDELISNDATQPSDWGRLGQNLRNQLEHSDTERQLDSLREFHHAQLLRLMLLELEGQLSVAALADELSALADLIINEALNCIDATVGPFAVIAYGKLGGKELGYVSDLDIVFLYDETSFDASNKDLPAQEYYARLARKLIQWLTVKTGAGDLFEVDIRLRPDGDSGLLVSSLSAFRDYQKNHAWLWEHQALTRARFCAGSPSVGAQFEALRLEILSIERKLDTTLKEVAFMREKVHAGHTNRSDLFDLKHDQGGMVDIEFSVQALVLCHASEHPKLCANAGNLALLKLASELGLIEAELAHKCIQIYQDLRRTQYALRLNDQQNGQQQTRIPEQQWVTQRATVKQLWDAVFYKAK